MVDIFDEVSGDLRAERAKALLRRYAVLLVALVVLVVLGVAGWQFWRWRVQQQSAQVAAAYIDASRLATPPPAALVPAAPARAQAIDAFAGIAANGPEGYRTLARLREAALKAPDDLPAALGLWDKVSADTGADPLLRGLADLLWVQHQVDTGEPAALEGRLAPLVAPGNPWRPLALESQAWLAVRTGDDGRARDILRGLQSDAQAPDGVRARAGVLLSQIDERSPAAAPAAAGAGG